MCQTASMPDKAPFTISPNASRAGVLKTRLLSDQWACLVARIINDVRSFGITTAPQIAADLNRRGIPTLRNGRWHASTVNNLLRRYAHARRTNPNLVAQTLRHPPPALLKHIAEHQVDSMERQRALRDPP